MFSCLHTLADRKKTTLRKLFTLYGLKLTVPYQVEFKDKEGKVEKSNTLRQPPGILRANEGDCFENVQI
jgi:hypothetical protein